MPIDFGALLRAHGEPRSPDEAMAMLSPETLALATRKPIQVRTARYITNHEPTRQMLKNANLVAFRDEPVLITGESGTGKELIARIMLANRPDDQFFPANCAGLVDTLFESLMFGHKIGAFTGATKDKPGLLVSAKHGVVFLDEIGELPLNQQAKLLRALQERRVMPVGSDYEIDIKCRFVFATNRDLVAEVTAGRFREDLYYRISALVLQTFPLRDRPDDAFLIAANNHRDGDPEIETMIPDAVIASRGNVRALENWLLQRRVFGVGADGLNPAMGDNV